MKIFPIFFGSLVSLSFFGQAAIANTLQMCNYSTQEKVFVAYSSYVDGQWWVQGWRPIEQGECTDFYHEGTSFYYYANSADGPYRWSGDVNHCVIESKFKIVDNRNKCNNGRWEGFIEVTGIGDFHRVRLID